jgi:hypothetical protein
MRVFVHLPGKDARRWVAQRTRALVEAGRPRLVPIDPLSQNIRNRETTASIGRAFVALPRASGGVVAGPNRGCDRGDRG